MLRCVTCVDYSLFSPFCYLDALCLACPIFYALLCSAALCCACGIFMLSYACGIFMLCCACGIFFIVLFLLMDM